MTPRNLLFALFAPAAVLWLMAALRLLLLAGWPLPPFDPQAMTLPEIRLAFGLMPRALVALLVGAALGLAGALMQRVLRNPLADPTVLGVSSGAQLALVAATLLAPALLEFGRLPVALLGGGAAAALVMGLAARRGFEPAGVAISGMLVGLLATGLATALTLARGEYLLSLVIWNGGALVQQDWSGVWRLAIVLLGASLAAALLLRPLRVLALGAATAGSLGLRVGWLRAGVMAVAVLLAAFVAAEVGMVGFIGLAAPTLARALPLRTEAARLGATMLIGAGLLWLCDGVVLLLADQFGEMFPTGALTGLLGAPLLLWLLHRLTGRSLPQREGAAHTRAAHPQRRIAGLLALCLAGAALLMMLGRGPDGWMLLDAARLDGFLPLRLPRLVGAMAAGALLAGAGAILQRLTANPLASPEVLGVSGGAALGYAAVVFVAPAAGLLWLGLGAAAGAAGVLVPVLVLTLRSGAAPERMLLAGLGFGAMASAVLSAMMAVGDARAWAVLNWLAGSAAGISGMGAATLALLALGLAASIVAMGRWLAILPLGPQVAGGLGLPRAARVAAIAAAGVATGTATVLVGPMSFAGLMAPHLARAMGLVTPVAQALGAMVLGALLMTVADAGARFATFPYDLPLGLFATLIGTPWLLLLMMRRVR